MECVSDECSMMNLMKSLSKSHNQNDRGFVIAKSGLTRALLDANYVSEIDSKQYKYGGFIRIKPTDEGILAIEPYVQNT